MKKYDELKAAILAEPSASYWLKGAVIALEKRDPVDAVCDAESLRVICEARLEEAA